MAGRQHWMQRLSERLGWNSAHCDMRALWLRADKHGQVGEVSLNKIAEGNSRAQLRLSVALHALEDLGAVKVDRDKGRPLSVHLVDPEEWGGDQ